MPIKIWRWDNLSLERNLNLIAVPKATILLLSFKTDMMREWIPSVEKLKVNNVTRWGQTTPLLGLWWIMGKTQDGAKFRISIIRIQDDPHIRVYRKA